MSLSGYTVVLLRTSSVARLSVYKQLRSLGLKLIVVHPIYNDKFQDSFDDWILADTDDIDALEQTLNTELARRNVVPDAVLSFDEYAVYAAAVLSERLGKRAIPLSSAALKETNMKSAFRQFCYAHGINAPLSAVVEDPSSDVEAALSQLTMPIVLKPTPGAGSLLAKLCTTMEEAKEHAKVMWDVLTRHPDVKYLRSLGTNVKLLAEEYIGGQEVDIDCAIENGKVKFASISDNFDVTAPYFVERGGTCPSRLDDDAQAAISDLLASFLSAHGAMCHGVLHFEAKYDFDRKKAFVIEVNCRMGSAEVDTMMTTVYGVHLGECLVRLALGKKLVNLDDDSSRVKKYCASVNLYPSSEGVLVEVAAPVEEKSLVAYSIAAAVGQVVSPPPKTFGLMAWMVAQGNTMEAAMENIDMLSSKFIQRVVAAE